MKMDPYYQRQKCRPMILVSGNIRFMGIFAGGLSTTAIFLAIWVTTSSEILAIRPAILYGDVLPLAGL